MTSTRSDLLNLYQCAIDAVAADAVTEHWLRQHQQPQTAVVAVGKAAAGMMQGAVKALGERFLSGLMISSDEYLAQAASFNHLKIEKIASDHPVPNQRSLDAGQRLIEFINLQNVDTPMLFLISGGASSMVEALPETVDLAKLQQLNRWLLASGLNIEQMNSIRQRCSLIKGGGLLGSLGKRTATVLYISDVKHDSAAIVGSGLLYLGNSIRALPKSLPFWLETLLAADLPRKPVNHEVPHHLVGSLNMALEAIEEKARELGYQTFLNNTFIEGDAALAGRQFAQQLIDAAPGLYIQGGETTVQLNDKPGKGGRNQHFCLAAARRLDRHENIFILAAGTDGIDGNTPDAGAVVDTNTLARLIADGVDAKDKLKCFDSNTALALSGDLLHIGATGTNVMDIMLGLKL